MKEKTLYDFLSLAPTASWNQLCEAADSMKKKILAKGDKTGRDNAVQSLCGLCVVIFKDVASKKKYDNYVNLTKYRAVNEAVDELALSNQKRIEPKMKESLIDIAVRQYHVSVSDASVYINHYCEYMGYALPENKIVCGLCGTENPAGTTNCVKCGKPLIIPCPACSAENNNSAKVCAKCGFDLTKMDKAVELLRQAKQKYSEKALEEAERLVKEAKAYWPNHADVLGLEKTIQDERKQAADTIAAIMKDIQDKDTLKRNLAVVINKVDIPTLEEKIGEIAAQQYLAENAETCKSYMDARDAVCRNFLEEYGAGNFVRTAEAKFKTVRYFTCSALGHNHEGQPYEGKNVVDPVMWLLQQADSSIKAE